MPARSLGDSSAPVRVCVSPECRAGHAGCEQAGGRAGERGLVHPCADMGRGRTPAWVQAPGSAGSAATPPAAVGPCTFPSGAPRATRRRRGPCRRAPLAPVATGRRAGTRSSRILASRRASSASTSSSQLPAPIDQKFPHGVMIPGKFSWVFDPAERGQTSQTSTREGARAAGAREKGHAGPQSVQVGSGRPHGHLRGVLCQLHRELVHSAQGENPSKFARFPHETRISS